MFGDHLALLHLRRQEYYAWLLILETAMLGVFLAQDLILFYVSFELTLVPMFFLIAIYGGKNRAHASVKFFIYTFTGSLFTLAGFVYVAWQYAQTGSRGIGLLQFTISQRLPQRNSLQVNKAGFYLHSLQDLQ